jgi:hypothetical protein
MKGITGLRAYWPEVEEKPTVVVLSFVMSSPRRFVNAAAIAAPASSL